MVGTSNFTDNEAWVKQFELFGSSPIYLLAKSVTFNQENLTSYKPKTNIDPTITGSESAIGDADNLNRRKGKNTHVGLNALNITVSGDIDLYELGSIESNNTITPGILYTMTANGHKRYRFFDNRIGSAWVHDPDAVSAVQKPYDSTNGIPVTLVSYSISAGVSDNILNYELVFREDVED